MQDLDYYLERCEQAGAKAWIMDLRGNGGGASLAEVLGRFMDTGPILVEQRPQPAAVSSRRATATCSESSARWSS